MTENKFWGQRPAKDGRKRREEGLPKSHFKSHLTVGSETLGAAIRSQGLRHPSAASWRCVVQRPTPLSPERRRRKKLFASHLLLSTTHFFHSPSVRTSLPLVEFPAASRACKVPTGDDRESKNTDDDRESKNALML